MGGRGSASATGTPRVMSEQEYLDRKGVGSAVSDYTLDKVRMPHPETARQKSAREAATLAAAREHAAKRAAARDEYRALVESGKVRPPSNVESLLKTARGRSENESVQAARRALKKRGWDWKTGRKL